MYEGQPRQITFEYRDPWEWIVTLVQDESLAPWHMWNAVKKFYCYEGHEEQIYDEPNTANVWWEVDVRHPLFLATLLLILYSLLLRMSLVTQVVGSPTAFFHYTFGWTKALSRDV